MHILILFFEAASLKIKTCFYSFKCIDSSFLIYVKRPFTDFIFLLVVGLLLFSETIKAQPGLFHSPADRIIGCTGAVENSAWAFFSNPSGTSGLSYPVAGMGYESPYSIKELSSRAIFVIMPTNIITLGGGFSQYGFSYYNIQQYALSFAREMAPWLRLGVRFNYLVRHQMYFRNLNLIIVDFGFQTIPLENVVMGFYVINPSQEIWDSNNSNDHYPSMVSASVLYKATHGLVVESGVSKQIENKAVFSFSLDKNIADKIALRGGFSSSPFRYGLGTGIKLTGLSFDVGLNYHSALGISSAFGILYEFGKLTAKK